MNYYISIKFNNKCNLIVSNDSIDCVNTIEYKKGTTIGLYNNEDKIIKKTTIVLI